MNSETIVKEAHHHVSAPSGAVVCGRRFATKQVVAFGIVFVFATGLILGFAVKPPSEDPEPWDRISSVIGWWYFTAWVVSFLPQLYLNYVRKCVIGQSFDYVFMNVLGFTCYSIYAICFHFVQSVQDDYEARFHSKNTVDINDVGFAVYSFCLVIFNSWQIYAYDRGTQTVSRFTLSGIGLTLIVFSIWLIILASGVRTSFFFNTLDLLYGLSLVKLAVTVIKYLPQIYLNYQRKLTVGWNIWNVLLDFTGGTLSVTQQMIDCGTTGRWNGIAGNPIKFCLGSMSIIYDIVFMLQHFVFYKENNRELQSAVATAHLTGGPEDK